MNSFASLGLHDTLTQTLAELQYTTPTPIQAQAIPPAISGRDVLGCAQTGTGKTAAFALPILDFLAFEKPPTVPGRPTALILAPTRELAIQIGANLHTYGKRLRVRQTLVYGGVSQHPQVKALRRGVDTLIATPGRLVDLMNQGHVDLGDVEVFVLDEADRMLDMGFLPALNQIRAALPTERQSLFFSATLSPKIRQLAKNLLYDPISIDVTPKVTSVRRIKQSIRMVTRDAKLPQLQELLSDENVDRAIVFTRTKHGADNLSKKLDRLGIPAKAIHGNKSQNHRQKTLDLFRRGRVNVLVATDVAARGIDVSGISHVVNYDMPVEPENYVHRIGRTGRAGAAGIAISFCTKEERPTLRAIEKLIDQRLLPSSTDEDDGPSKRRQSHARHRSRRSNSESPNRGNRWNKKRRSSRAKPTLSSKPR